MTLNAKIGFYGLFGDCGLKDTFQWRIVPKSLDIDRDSMHMKLIALNVAFTCLNFALPPAFKEFSIWGHET